MKNNIVMMSCILVLVLMLTACAGTKMVAGWKDEEYNAHPAKVFIISVKIDSGPRSLVEDEFVRLLKEHGTDAVASYPVLPAEPKPDKDAVLAKVREAGADVIMVVRFLRKDMADAGTPVQRYAVPVGFNTGWDTYYGGVSSQVGIRDVMYDKDVITAETMLYQTATGKPIWSMLSQTTYEGGPIKQIKPFAGAVIKELAHAKIIK